MRVCALHSGLVRHGVKQANVCFFFFMCRLTLHFSDPGWFCFTLVPDTVHVCTLIYLDLIYPQSIGFPVVLMSFHYPKKL